MSMDKAFKEMIRGEIESQLKPLRDSLARLEAGTSDLEDLRNVTDRLAPLASLFGGAAPAKPAAAKKVPGKPGRPAKVAEAPAAPAGKKRGRKPGVQTGAAGRSCAIIGCGKPSRTKGYCAAHYQKLRMLEKTNRRPGAWIDYADQNTVEDVVLPRGRAAAKALAEAAKSMG